MERDAAHSVPMAAIRRLAIECHALDTSPLALGHAKTHDDRDHQTYKLFREVLTERLLQLAIALRTKFYQGEDPVATRAYLQQTGFLEVIRRGQSKTIDINFKDVCDKVVHAQEIVRDYDYGHAEQGVLTVLRGADQSGGAWTMGISVALFCEAVLNWARDSAA